MPAWRNLGALLAVLVLVQVSRCEPSYNITETVKVDECFRVNLDMSLTGELRVNREGKSQPIKLEARAKHAFQERVLILTNNLPSKMARVYDAAQASITTGADRTERTLRPQRKLIVSQHFNDVHTTYCPQGALLREELELTNDHLDTLVLTGLLPATEVKIGEKWKIANEVVQVLCGFEGLVSHELEGKLEEVKDNTARVIVKGTASGIDTGASVKLSIEAVCLVDLKAHRLAQVEWKQTDDREQGPVNPASTVNMTTIVKREAIAEPECLGQVALVGVPDGREVPVALTQLWYHDSLGRFELTYGREWQVVAQTREHLVMRLMERGDFIAQATITSWRAAAKGQHMSPSKFREVIENTPGWVTEKELQAGDVASTIKDGWTHRISVLGQVDEVPAVQNYYVIAGPNGDQAVALFTMTPKQAAKLGSRDLTLAGGLEFPQKP
jgi:hypothetical protein